MLQRDIENLKKLENHLGELHDAVHDSIQARVEGTLANGNLQSKDTKLKIAKLDANVREEYRKIEKLAKLLILKAQPVASDLRSILKVLRKADEFKQVHRLINKLGVSNKDVVKALARSVSTN